MKTRRSTTGAICSLTLVLFFGFLISYSILAFWLLQGIHIPTGHTPPIRSETNIALITNLEALVASLQAQAVIAATTISALQANASQAANQAAIAAGTISDLQANVTSSMSQISSLKSQVSSCQMQLSSSFNSSQVNTAIYTQLVSEYAFGVFDQVTPTAYKTVARLSNNNNAKNYEDAGGLIWDTYNPEAAFYLSNAGDDTLVRDMQGSVFKFPTVGNKPENVTFDLPSPPAYSQPSDLYFKSILELAALLRAGTVSCVTIVQAFIDRLSDIDPYLGIVATPLYDQALALAVSNDEKLKNGIDLGPLMCIPFGIKDHHQIFDNDPTMYGHILFSYNVQTVKSTLANHLMKYGAIPIAKTMLGTFASGSGNGWGMCMSPYLNGPGSGSSCGSGSGAAYGAFPFAISEETSGSVASPSAASLISGHITSYGLTSRGGSGLLCHELDHLGFHSRYLSDFGVILNYVRTGKDPLDGDTVDIPFVNPATVDVTKLRVLIVGGQGMWIKSSAGAWVWDNGKIQAFNKSAWHWPGRVAKMKARLEAAGVTVDILNTTEAAKLWSFNKATPYWSCANPSISQLKAGGAWARLQQFEFAHLNSKSKSSSKPNIPVKSYRYLKKCMVEIGKKYLNDPVWAKYDVIIDTPFNTEANYDFPGSGFEQWVRTAKTFVIDYYEALPCATPQGDTVEGAYAVLTALPHQDHKNFAIGAIIQDKSAIIFPNTTAIKKAFTNRERCAYTMMNARNNMTVTCPALNGPGAPPSPTLAGFDGACVIGGPQQHLPTSWANSKYVAPYLLADKCPDEAIWAWSELKPIACTAVCKFLPSFCAHKNINCSARRLAEEKELHRPGQFSTESLYMGDDMKNHPLYVNHDDER